MRWECTDELSRRTLDAISLGGRREIIEHLGGGCLNLVLKFFGVGMICVICGASPNQ